MSNTDLWDSLSANYDLFVNWEQRLAREMPFLETRLASHGARRVLDVACGTGHHAIALAKRGYDVVGTDISAGMVDRARQNAEAAAVAVSFVQTSFGELHKPVKEPFDALLCLGNSLPSVLSEEALKLALADMAGLLAPGGLMVIQNLNYDRLWPQRQRFLPLETHREDGQELLFLRFMDFHERSLTFNMVVLHKQNSSWDYWAESTQLRPIFADELTRELGRAGLAIIETYADYSCQPYDPKQSGDLIVVAQKREEQDAAKESIHKVVSTDGGEGKGLGTTGTRQPERMELFRARPAESVEATGDQSEESLRFRGGRRRCSLPGRSAVAPWREQRIVGPPGVAEGRGAFG